MADPKFFFEFFLIAINATGVMAWTSDESCLNGEENLSIVDRILWNTHYGAFQVIFGFEYCFPI